MDKTAHRAQHLTAALVAVGLAAFDVGEASSQQRPQGCGPDPPFRPTGGEADASDARLPAGTHRISLDAGGRQANNSSGSPAVSASGRFVAFHSRATNLAPRDRNRRWDVFVYDRVIKSIKRASVRSDGGQSNGASIFPSISGNGRLVAFRSTASNLVPGDTNRRTDAFVYDRGTGEIRRASIATRGRQANRDIKTLNLSQNGRVAIFSTAASGLVRGDTNRRMDIFARDLVTRRTTRLSISNFNQQANNDSQSATVSADGRYVGFRSLASNLVSGDTNGIEDVFVFDRRLNRTTRVNVTRSGAQVFNRSFRPTLSASGRFVVFRSTDPTLVVGDTNGQVDVFVRDLAAESTERVSVSSSRGQGNGHSYRPSISGNGRYVVFASTATNLVSSDTNGRPDVFRHDRRTRMTTRVSITFHGRQANGCSINPKTNGDGRVVVFTSTGRNLVRGDTNRVADVFARVYRP
jgi:Tol biopolymer transport system component